LERDAGRRPRTSVGRCREHADALQIVSGFPGREVVHHTAPPSAQELGLSVRLCSLPGEILRQRHDDHAAWVLNARQRKVIQRLLDDGDGGFLGGLNAAKYMKMTGASKATATRDLSDLVSGGLLRTRGLGKALRYGLTVPGWGEESGGS
jgi:hypothetical protein